MRTCNPKILIPTPISPNERSTIEWEPLFWLALLAEVRDFQICIRFWDANWNEFISNEQHGLLERLMAMHFDTQGVEHQLRQVGLGIEQCLMRGPFSITSIPLFNHHYAYFLIGVVVSRRVEAWVLCLELRNRYRDSFCHQDIWWYCSCNLL